jgi:hypothetical protein
MTTGIFSDFRWHMIRENNHGIYDGKADFRL